MLSVKNPVPATSRAIVSGSSTMSFARVARAAGTRAPTVISGLPLRPRRAQLDDASSASRRLDHDRARLNLEDGARADAVAGTDDPSVHHRQPSIGGMQNRRNHEVRLGVDLGHWRDDDIRLPLSPRSQTDCAATRARRTRSTSGGAGTVVGSMGATACSPVTTGPDA